MNHKHVSFVIKEAIVRNVNMSRMNLAHKYLILSDEYKEEFVWA